MKCLGVNVRNVELTKKPQLTQIFVFKHINLFKLKEHSRWPSVGRINCDKHVFCMLEVSHTQKRAQLFLISLRFCGTISSPYF